jgi:flagellar M-ring protein FliF
MANGNVIQGGIQGGRRQSPLDQVPGLRQLVLLVGLAAAEAVGVWLVLWMREDSYSVLFANLTDRDAVEIVQVLESSGIPHRYESGSGAVMVASDRLHEARLQLASQDLPGGSGVGFEMFNDGGGMSDSQFMESARYQRALEVELGRTVASISAVSSARVHLAVPRQSVFVRERVPASASVLVNLYPGRQLERDQVESVVNLVASSVPDMESGQVTVVDQNGSLLSADRDEAAADGAESMDDRVQRMEARYTRRIEDLLTPLVGVGKVRAQVALTMNAEQVEETQEIYDPENQVVRSEQSSETPAGEGLARGVPGALSNQPPATDGDAPPAGTLGPGAAGAADDDPAPAMATDVTRNYEIGRTIRHLQQPPGGIQRLSVAVVVDQKRVTGPDGEVQQVAYDADELDRMGELVRQAVGFDEARGDSVSVVNAAFTDPGAFDSDVEGPSFLDRVDVNGSLRTLGTVVVLLLLVFAVVRPTLKQLVATLPPRNMALPPAAPQSLAAPEGEEDESYEERPSQKHGPKQEYEERIATAKTIVQQDPKRVAQVVRGWVNEDGG